MWGHSFLVGAIIATNSQKVAIHGTLTIVVSALFPFAEEPWLREHYGEEYEAFRERTPRFVGWDLLTKLVGVS